MIYLSSFSFPSREEESGFFMGVNETCYNCFYPFGILCDKGLDNLEFGNITLLYGSNGCGKTTVLNVIAEKLGLERSTLYNRSDFFEKYTDRCYFKLEKSVPDASRIITSDDVFDYMLDLRSYNKSIDRKREGIFDEYADRRNFSSGFRMNSMDDFDELREINAARRMTKSQFTKHRLVNNLREHSNGESAFLYFAEKIKDGRLYLLDEPENSLSPDKQIELSAFISDMARFFGCQFIISTHSPLLLSMKGAVVYNLDSKTARRQKWTELANVRIYYDFFKEHEDEFDEKD